MGKVQDYRRAYERQKKARERAENLLEVHSRELYEANATLKTAYDRLQDQKNQLVQQEKLASIGLLAAGIAHELNNPIGYIKSNLQILEQYLSLVNRLLVPFQAVAAKVQGSPEDLDYRQELTALVQLAREHDLAFVIKDSLDAIQESLSGTQRVEDIIVNLRDFSRTDSDERVLCNINEVLENALKLVWNEIKYRINVVRHFGDLPAIYACTGQLNQVFINIILNAAQAMQHKGTLTITTEEVEHDVRIDFVDSGPGIAEEHLLKLFDPFFTTKDIGDGTGLGLYVSHGLIKKHRGDIMAGNEPGGGARFTIYLPIDMRKGTRENI